MKDREAGETSNQGASAPLRGALGLSEAAQYLGVSRRTVERLVAEASIGVARIGVGGGRVVIRVSELERYLAEHAEPAISATAVRSRRRAG